jgi:hypothetical protein
VWSTEREKKRVGDQEEKYKREFGGGLNFNPHTHLYFSFFSYSLSLSSSLSFTQCTTPHTITVSRVCHVYRMYITHSTHIIHISLIAHTYKTGSDESKRVILERLPNRSWLAIASKASLLKIRRSRPSEPINGVG